eukprot:scaffold260791_cov18-Prasinocladus_malaysianus.AAC.1
MQPIRDFERVASLRVFPSLSGRRGVVPAGRSGRGAPAALPEVRRGPRQHSAGRGPTAATGRPACAYDSQRQGMCALPSDILSAMEIAFELLCGRRTLAFPGG